MAGRTRRRAPRSSGERDVEYVLVSTTGDRDQTSDLHAIGGRACSRRKCSRRCSTAPPTSRCTPPRTSRPRPRPASCSRDPRTRRSARRARRFHLRGPGLGRARSAPVRCAGAPSSRRPGPTSRSGRCAGTSQTRLRKRDELGYDAIVVAFAALERLGLVDDPPDVIDVLDVDRDAAAGRAGRARGRVPRRRRRARSRACTAIDDRVAHRGGRRRARLPRRARRRLRPSLRRARRVGGPDGAIVLEALLASLDGHVVAAHARGRRRPVATSVPPPPSTCSTARAGARSWTTSRDRLPGRRGTG